MRSAILLHGLVSLVAASPAPQLINFSMIQAAPMPAQQGPALTATAQTLTYNTAAVAASATAAASGLATAVATMKKRDVVSSTSTTTTTLTVQSTSSATTSSDTSCPTQPEAGTYCGFINPEDDCAPQPGGYGPSVTPDTTDAFLAFPTFAAMANNAATPAGYVNTFKNMDASTSANTYLGLQTLTSYSPLTCSQFCDNTTLCTAFNIYIERDPSLNPTLDSCSSPSSITNYKCTLWGSGVDASTATNSGGWRNSFPVVITGSNGYAKTNNTVPATPTNATTPQMCPVGKCVNKPTSAIGTHFFPGAFDPSLCAAYAVAQNARNKALLSWIWALVAPFATCKSVNAYMMKQDGKPLGTYCALYTANYQPNDCTYQPGWQGGHFWGVESSCVFKVQH